MLILDVIREAATEHEVYFLLTSYVEAVRHFDHGGALPRPLLELPLRGMSDIERRVIGLAEELDRGAAGGGASDGALVREALGIFATALLSLARIKGPTDPAMGRAGPRPVTAEQARMTG